MTAQFPDFHPQIEEVLNRLLRYASTFRKMEMVDQLNRAIKQLALAKKRDIFAGKKPQPIGSPTLPGD